MSREGRAQPIQPFAGHGFLGNTPANGVLPPPPTVVPLDQRGRSFVIPPATAQHGFVDPGLVATTPPPPIVIDRTDQRVRYRPLDPVLLSAAYLTVPPPAATPVAPFVVPLDERKRFLAQLPPSIVHGYDDADPPPPNVVNQEDRRARRLPLDPFTISGGQLAGIPPTFVPPPGPFVVPIEERRYILDRLRQPDARHGFVDPGPGPVGTTPPPGQNIDRADQRIRFLPQPTLVLSGVLAPFIPPPPVVVNAGTDWAAEMSTF